MITELKITNFRSLREVWLDNLQPVNLLIGPNNSGKSNILKALKFFSEFLGGNVPDEARLKGYIFNSIQDSSEVVHEPLTLRFYSKLDELNTSIGFGEVTLYNTRNSGGFPSFGIVCAKGQQGYQMGVENVAALDETFPAFEAQYYHFPMEVIPPTNTSMNGLDGGDYAGIRYVKEFEVPRVSDTIHNPQYGYFKTDTQRQVFSPLQNLKIYRPEPSKLLELYPIQNEQSVNEDASNLVAFLDTMSRRNQKIFKRITDDLQEFVPEFEYISYDVLDTPPKELQLKYPNRSLARIGLTDKHGRNFWADSLSEGTLYFLSLLCIIHQPEPPKLLLIEEPEKGIHPRRIRETIDLIFQLTDEKGIQVILTTHSPSVVDIFADMPQAIYIVEREGQETNVKNLQRDVIEPHNEEFIAAGEEPIRFTEALGENWAMGFLGGVPECKTTAYNSRTYEKC